MLAGNGLSEALKSRVKMEKYKKLLYSKVLYGGVEQKKGNREDSAENIYAVLISFFKYETNAC